VPEQLFVIGSSVGDDPALDVTTIVVTPPPPGGVRVHLSHLPEGARSVMLTTDRTAMDHHVRSCYLEGGWDAVAETADALAAARGPLAAAPSPEVWANHPAGAVARVWGEAARGLLVELIRALRVVERTARAEIVARLERSRTQVRSEAERYLDEVGAAPFRDRTLVFPPGVRLTRRPDAQTLRRRLEQVGRLRDELVDAMIDAGSVTDPSGGTHQVITPELVEAEQRLDAYVAAVALDSPLFTWIAGIPSGASDQTLLSHVQQELARAWDASYQVQDAVRAGFTAPSRIWPNPDEDPIERVFVDWKTVADEALGPWAYPSMISHALDELGYVAPSEVAVAAGVAVTAAGEALEFLIGTGLLAVTAACPPLGIPLDLMVSTHQLYEAVEGYERAGDAYRAILDRGESILEPPGLAGIIAASLGVAGSVVPGAWGFLVGGLQLGVGLTNGTRASR
jgi:hypothetical protein